MPAHLTRRLREPWSVLLLAGASTVACYPVLPSELVQQGLTLALGVGCLVAIGVGVRVHRPQGPLPWLLLALGVAVYLAADLTYIVLDAAVVGEPPFPSVADVGYYLYYLGMGAAHLVILRRRAPGRDGASLIDALLVSVAAAVLSWTFLMAPYAKDPSLGLLEKSASLGYPVCDVLLVALLVRLALSTGKRLTPFLLIVTAFALMVFADAVYGYQVLAGTYVTGSLLDCGWLLAYVLWGAAALHPSMAQLTARQPAGAPTQSRRRLGLMAVAALTAPALLVWQPVRFEALDVLVVAGGCIVMFTLVLMRMSGLLREVEVQRDELSTALRSLEQAQAERRALLDRTVQAGEQERIRVAADLHDGPIQRLAAVCLLFDRALLRLDRGDVTTAGELVERGHEELSAEVDALRRVMSELRPPVLDEAGLAVGLRDLMDDFCSRHAVEGHVEAMAPVGLGGDAETALYRVVQEALSNIGKHAQARSVQVRLVDHGDEVVLTVTDDGHGFSVQSSGQLLRGGHYGLVGMRERLEAASGSFEVQSSPGAGACVIARLPVVRVPAQRSDEPAAVPS